MPRPKRWKDDAERKRYERAQAKADAMKKAAEERHPKAVASAPQDDDADILKANALSPVLDAALRAPSANRAVLEAIRDNPGALDSDRIRSVTELSKLDFVEKDQRGDVSPILAWRDVFAALPVGDRLKAWKSALDHMRDQGTTGVDLDAETFTYKEES